MGAAAYGFEAVPLLGATATPGGTVSAGAYETLVGELLHALEQARPFDGILLSLHGAMVSESIPDVEGELLRRIREIPTLIFSPRPEQ